MGSKGKTKVSLFIFTADCSEFWLLLSWCKSCVMLSLAVVGKIEVGVMTLGCCWVEDEEACINVSASAFDRSTADEIKKRGPIKKMHKNK